MSYERFDFPYHQVADRYPESSTVVQYGKGYRFASKPRAPDQIKFELTFPAMWFFVQNKYDANGYPYSLLDNNTEPKRNIARLISFYERHQMWKKFEYFHPWRGIQICRFDKPLDVPKVVPGSMGLTESFNINFILCP
jgi:hypothetical protein